MTKYLRIHPSDGYIYESLKQQDPEGRAKVVKTKQGATYYHDVWARIDGRFLGIEKRNTDFGRQLALKFKTDSDYVHVTLNMDGKYRLDEYFRDFIQTMPNLEKGANISFSTNTTKRDKKGRLYPNLYFVNTDTNMPTPWAFEPKEIPSGEEKIVMEEGRPGEPDKEVKRWDFKKADKFLFAIFEQNYDNLEESPQNSKPEPELATGAEEKMNEDDMPF